MTDPIFSCCSTIIECAGPTRGSAQLHIPKRMFPGVRRGPTRTNCVRVRTQRSLRGNSAELADSHSFAQTCAWSLSHAKPLLIYDLFPLFTVVALEVPEREEAVYAFCTRTHDRFPPLSNKEDVGRIRFLAAKGVFIKSVRLVIERRRYHLLSGCRGKPGHDRSNPCVLVS